MPALQEQQARQTIDAMLAPAGRTVQDSKGFDPSASIRIALRKVWPKSGRVGYRRSVDCKVIGDANAENKAAVLSSASKQTRISAEVEGWLSVIHVKEVVGITELQLATRLRMQRTLNGGFQG